MSTPNQRICILRHCRFPWDGRVPKEAAELVACGYDVEVICLAGRSEECLRETVDGVDITRLPLCHRRGSIWRYLYEYGVSMALMGAILTWRSFRRRYVCIQVNTMPDALVFVTLIPRLLGSRILLDMHEPSPELCKAESRAPDVVCRLLAGIEQAAIRYAHAVLTVNDTIRERFIERGADPRKITVVRNVPPRAFGATPGPAISPAGDAFTVVTHGTLRPLYGHRVLIRAAALARRDIPNLRILVVGDGESLDALQAEARANGCRDIVTFTGEIPYRDIPDVLRQTQLGVVSLLPTSFGELCQPNKLFEYVALHIPVAAPRLPAITETFAENALAYYEPDNAADLARCLRACYRSPSYRDALESAAFERFQQVDWNDSSKRYLAVVRMLTREQRVSLPQELPVNPAPAPAAGAPEQTAGVP